MRVPSVLMRGGTSKGLFFHRHDLPVDAEERDRFILAAYGSPDPYRRQIDGIGGATSTTSKVAVIAPRDAARDAGAEGVTGGAEVDVLYDFGQVGIDSPLIDRRGNCGNISSAVGPFAVDEGLVTVTEPITIVRFLNVNTSKVIVAHVPTRHGAFDPVGDYELPGVPGTGSLIQLDYLDPAGAVTGALLPTGSVRDTLDVPGVGVVEASIVDAANPLVFIRWDAVGLTGHEQPDDVDADRALLERIEAVRAAAAVRAGIAETVEQATTASPAVPKLAFVGPPRDYLLSNGRQQQGSGTTLRAAMMSMGRLHRSYPLTGAICTAVAAAVPGTLPAEAGAGAGSSPGPSTDGETRIGHPAGVLPMSADVRADGAGGWTVASVSGYRTARRLMEGHVLVPDELLRQPLAEARASTQAQALPKARR